MPARSSVPRPPTVREVREIEEIYDEATKLGPWDLAVGALAIFIAGAAIGIAVAVAVIR